MLLSRACELARCWATRFVKSAVAPFAASLRLRLARAVASGTSASCFRLLGDSWSSGFRKTAEAPRTQRVARGRVFSHEPGLAKPAENHCGLTSRLCGVSVWLEWPSAPGLETSASCAGRLGADFVFPASRRFLPRTTSKSHKKAEDPEGFLDLRVPCDFAVIHPAKLSSK